MMTAAALIGYITRNPCKKTSVWPVQHEKSVQRKVPAMLFMKKRKDASQAAPASEPPSTPRDKNGYYYFLRITQDIIRFNYLTLKGSFSAVSKPNFAS